MKNTILIVDDDASYVELLQILLEDEGFEVTTAYRGRQALNIMSHEKIDLVLLDYQMPEAVYRVSRQKLPKKELELSYPGQWKSRWVKSSGEICLEGRRWFVGEAFAGQRVGLEKVGVGVMQVHFANMLLGEMHSADGGSIRPRTYTRSGRAQRSRSAGD